MSISPTLPRIRLLATGGTIAGAHNEDGRYESVAEIEVEQVFDLPFLPRRRV